jgi:flavin reductase (DIM6/NTAB) family NADH-FMN oxidoreductase RutF
MGVDMNSLVDPKDYRKTIGLFATGVTVVATEFEGKLQTMTANALTSVSLDPLLLLVCVGNQLEMSQSLGKTKGYTFNILREQQEALSNFFANMWGNEPPPSFQFAPWDGIPRLEGCIAFAPWDGIPRLEGSIASIKCVPHKVYDGGDHRLFVGRVVGLYKGDEPYEPLLFYAGGYGQLSK